MQETVWSPEACGGCAGDHCLIVPSHVVGSDDFNQPITVVKDCGGLLGSQRIHVEQQKGFIRRRQLVNAIGQFLQRNVHGTGMVCGEEKRLSTDIEKQRVALV